MFNFSQVSVVRGEFETLLDWFQTFRAIRASEVWQCHGEWVTKVDPTFGPGIKERFQVLYTLKPRPLNPKLCRTGSQTWVDQP